MAALERPEAAWRILPHVAEVEDMGVEQGDQLLRVTHAFGLFTGGYVVRLRREWKPNGRHLIRFWLDTRFPRDVDDARGYFEIVPLGSDRTILYYHVEAVLLPGLLRMFLRDKIQWTLMIVPARTRAFIEDQMVATRAAGTNIN